MTMVEKNSILIRYYRSGESISTISRELQISRKTVRKYISENQRQMNTEKLSSALEDGLSFKPEYNISTRPKRRLTTEIQEEIKICLAKNQQKRNQGMRKQLMKNKDIHEHLLSLGFQIGYSSVCQYIQAEESRGKECFIKQEYFPGQSCEFDWGEVKLIMNGRLQSFNLAVFTSCYSNFRFGKLFYRQDTLAFGQSHIDFFEYTQGVFKEMVYDNMRVVVSKFTGRNEKEPTVALLELSGYYKFDFRFCNVRKGNEKGHVERSVEYIRRKAFCTKDDFSSIEQANQHLLQICNKLNNSSQKLRENKTANELFLDEKSNFFAVSQAYKCFKEEHAKVDKYSTLAFLGNRYSVPDYLVGKLLTIRFFAEKLDVYLHSEKVCKHSRSYGAHTWTLDINHYLTTFTRKPGALKGSVVFGQSSEYMKSVYNLYFTKNSKDFVELLQYCKTNSEEFETVKTAIEKLQVISPTDINKDKILAVIAKEKEPVKESTTEKDEIETFAQASLSVLSEFINLT